MTHPKFHIAPGPDVGGRSSLALANESLTKRCVESHSAAVAKTGLLAGRGCPSKTYLKGFTVAVDEMLLFPTHEARQMFVEQVQGLYLWQVEYLPIFPRAPALRFPGDRDTRLCSVMGNGHLYHGIDPRDRETYDLYWRVKLQQLNAEINVKVAAAKRPAPREDAPKRSRKASQKLH